MEIIFVDIYIINIHIFNDLEVIGFLLDLLGGKYQSIHI